MSITSESPTERARFIRKSMPIARFTHPECEAHRILLNAIAASEKGDSAACASTCASTPHGTLFTLTLRDDQNELVAVATIEPKQGDDLHVDYVSPPEAEPYMMLNGDLITPTEDNWALMSHFLALFIAEHENHHHI